MDMCVTPVCVCAYCTGFTVGCKPLDHVDTEQNFTTVHDDLITIRQFDLNFVISWVSWTTIEIVAVEDATDHNGLSSPNAFPTTCSTLFTIGVGVKLGNIFQFGIDVLSELVVFLSNELE